MMITASPVPREVIDAFVTDALESLGCSRLSELGPLSCEWPTQVAPIRVGDFKHVTRDERFALSAAFWGRHGVAYFALTPPSSLGRHPLLEMATQLSDLIPTGHPVTHPGESDEEAMRLFGGCDGTLKVFARSGRPDSAESTELHMHQDGLGRAGTVVAAGLYCERGPIWGGLTCFQNALRLMLALAHTDWPAFESLFGLDTITILGVGRNSIKITGPVAYLGHDGKPHVLLRADSGDYLMTWAERPATLRARDFLLPFLAPLAVGSCFVSLHIPGHGCIFRNQAVLHSRTAFTNSDDTFHRRLLSRKWFASGAEYLGDLRVPGLALSPAYESTFPDAFDPDLLRGFWTYDERAEVNVPRV